MTGVGLGAEDWDRGGGERGVGFGGAGVGFAVYGTGWGMRTRERFQFDRGDEGVVGVGGWVWGVGGGLGAVACGDGRGCERWVKGGMDLGGVSDGGNAGEREMLGGGGGRVMAWVVREEWDSLAEVGSSCMVGGGAIGTV